MFRPSLIHDCNNSGIISFIIKKVVCIDWCRGWGILLPFQKKKHTMLLTRTWEASTVDGLSCPCRVIYTAVVLVLVDWKLWGVRLPISLFCSFNNTWYYQWNVFRNISFSKQCFLVRRNFLVNLLFIHSILYYISTREKIYYITFPCLFLYYRMGKFQSS
jgi:hypothetical protein